MREDMLPLTLPSPPLGERDTHRGKAPTILIPLPRRGGEGRVRGPYDAEDTSMKVLE
jgi:hypothetical protein